MIGESEAIFPPSPHLAADMTRIGKCQRYIAYERAPIHCNGFARKISAGPAEVPPPPALITSMVATTGSSAANPGKLVPTLNFTLTATIATRPSHPKIAVAQCPSRSNRPPANASAAPVSSSHARVGSMKKAHGCSSFVNFTHATNDTTHIPPITIANVRRDSLAKRTSSISRPGHTR